MNEQISFANFFQCRLERFNQRVRKLSQEPDGVREQDPLFVTQNKAARRRIQRGEKFVFCYYVRARKQIQQSRFPRIRITDYCSDRPLMAFSPLSLNGARFPHRFQLAFEPRYSFLHTPAVDFQLRFTRTARADPARLARQVIPHPSEAWQKILQLRQLDLQSTFPAACALRKNIENQLRSIDHLPRE